MGLLNNIYDPVNYIAFGNRSDVCVLTAREVAAKERITTDEANRKLRGHLEGKRIVKFRYNGSDVVISLDKIHEIASKYPSEKEVTVDEEAEDAK